MQLCARVTRQEQGKVVLTMPTAKRKHARTQTEVVIPEKIYFRIGEVSELAKLPTYVLRFWETEFPQLKPTKSNTGQRMYRRKDVEYVMQIRRLLYEDGFTIAGAREKLREEMRSNRLQPLPSSSADSVQAPIETSSQAPNPGAQDLEQAQVALPFFAPSDEMNNKEELRRLRQQLSDVLALLS
jgi:DNA-binding transcriptional MerR regulator